MTNLVPGTKVKYRAQNGTTREGIIKKVGRVWIEFHPQHGEGSAWCKPDAIMLSNSNNSANNLISNAEGRESDALSREETHVSERDNTQFGAIKLSAGTRCRFHKWNQHPDDPNWHVGVVVSWGRKFVEVTREDDGSKDWGLPATTFFLAEGEEPPPVVDYGGSDSPFLTATLGSIIGFRTHPAEGIQFGLFLKYNKYFHQVEVESTTTPSWAKKPTVYKLREDLCFVERYKLDFKLLEHSVTYRLEWRDKLVDPDWDVVAEGLNTKELVPYWKSHKKERGFGQYRVVTIEHTRKEILEEVLVDG